MRPTLHLTSPDLLQIAAGLPPLPLSPMESALVRVLLDAQGGLVPTERLMHKLYVARAIITGEPAVKPNGLVHLVHQLRRRCRRAGLPDTWLTTVRGWGYRIAA
jgi:DNA-binding response OmpR family regulator